ncbi:hypothetical protein N7466_009034 [Penicillium verhagenii]|uniref:uncharacterized protein n=1 Tax=Penicillium verhagenii TaxID=1562060 RepID=UPI002544D837|nr:uncharacterized protein N7466_009034 [Penicillium verhagenii]KAJ5924847.1 hypothetical protein N7466_009034 [Penicillium verhagenii]
MSGLDPVTSGLGRIPINKTTETATKPTKSIPKLDRPVKQIQKQTKDITDPIIPGEFPRDEGAPRTQHEPTPPSTFAGLWNDITGWFSNIVPSSMDRFEGFMKWLVMYLLPPKKQTEVYEAAMKRPIASTFIVCQLICCGVPLLVFLAGVFVFAAVALVLWAVLSLLILGPVLLVASMMGVSLWGWGWVLYGILGWVDQRFLGGMIGRFWMPRLRAQEEGVEGEEGKGEGEGGGEGKGDEEKKDV